MKEDKILSSGRFGPYQILGEMGRGSMGIVYRAVRDGTPDVPCALKVLHAQALDPESKLRFKREAGIVVRMNHPNIVKGLECGEFDGRAFVAMELVRGQTLASMIRDATALDERTVLRVGMDIARALEHIHGQGMIHRDIKPENVIVAESGVAKLMDLGLAKSSEKDASWVTEPGVPIGTPAYMSPEHISCTRNLDIRTDIYGLGATLYHAVTGLVPFGRFTLHELVQKKMMGQQPEASQDRAGVSPHLSTLLKVMMSFDPRNRHASPAELLGDLQRVNDGHAPARAPVAPPSRPQARSAPPSASRAWEGWWWIALALGVLVIAAWALFFLGLRS